MVSEMILKHPNGHEMVSARQQRHELYDIIVILQTLEDGNCLVKLS